MNDEDYLAWYTAYIKSLTYDQVLNACKAQRSYKFGMTDTNIRDKLIENERQRILRLHEIDDM